VRTKAILGITLAAMMTGELVAQANKPPEKWFVVEGAVNTQSGYMLRVDVDRPDRTYAVGQTMTVTVRADKDCYLYLLYYGAGDKVGCLFPNKYQQDNFVRANTTVAIPAAGSDFQIVARPPCGSEILQVIGSSQPIEVLKGQNPQEAVGAPLQASQLKDMVVELKQNKARDWAEARIAITTHDPAQGTTQETAQGKRPRRYAVCIGISEYESDRVPKLRICHKDAERMAAALKEHGQVDEVLLLTNAGATREAIERAIFKWLVEKTQAGDEVFIYFSGHGGRCADTSGDKPDGLAKYLVPFDGKPGKPDTMILDRVFARWLRELDGRRIGIVLDNCYAGGIAKGEHGQGIKGLGGPQPKAAAVSDVFLIGELAQAKAIGQSGVELLAACEGNQIAWEMPTDDDGSVLTYHVIRSLENPKADLNGDQHISVGEVYQYTKPSIEEYVRKTFSTEQTPVLLDQANDEVYLKP
jgi:uncharacterized caspase-like protein